MRHGAVQAPDDEKRCISSTELPLSGLGKRQAEQAGEFLAGKQIGALLTSPLLRAGETAGLIGDRLGLVPVTVDALREVRVG